MKGYKLVGKEFDETLRSIVQLGYGLVLISHAQDKSFTDEAGKEFNQIVPTLDKRPQNIVSRMCDIIGYARPVQNEEGNLSTKLYMRGTPRFVAGSRFKYTPDFIDFTYENLVNAISNAIDKQMEEVGSELFTEKRENVYIETADDLDFDELSAEFHDMVSKLQNNYSDEEFGEYWAPRIVQVTEKYLGKGKKVRELTRDQVEVLDLVVTAMKDLIGAGMNVPNKE